MARPDVGSLLIVEDSPEDYALTLWALQRAGFNGSIQHAACITETLGYLCRNTCWESRLFDVMLLDLNLSDGTGLDLLATLRTQYEGTLPLPVVILTTSDHPRDVTQCYRLGAAGYFIKPLGRAPFADQMRIFVEYWFKATVLPPLTR